MRIRTLNFVMFELAKVYGPLKSIRRSTHLKLPSLKNSNIYPQFLTRRIFIKVHRTKWDSSNEYQQFDSLLLKVEFHKNFVPSYIFLTLQIVNYKFWNLDLTFNFTLRTLNSIIFKSRNISEYSKIKILNLS